MHTSLSLMGIGEIGIFIMMGISLAAVAGLRAFLPLCVVSWMAHEHVLTLAPAYGWLGSDAAVLIFTLAMIVEIAADKIPVVDNVLDHIADWVKPVAGTILVSGFITAWDPLVATVFGLLAGGSVATLFHQAKKLTRLTSTAATLGLGNPVISVGEDLAGIAGTFAGIFLAPLAFAFVCCVGWLLFKSGQKIWMWFRARPTSTPAPT